MSIIFRAPTIIQEKKKKRTPKQKPHSNKLEYYMYKALNTKFEEIILQKFLS